MPHTAIRLHNYITIHDKYKLGTGRQCSPKSELYGHGEGEAMPISLEINILKQMAK